ncbi:MAG: hypothetical protein WEA09_15950 [Gemmatimonadota bacterium]
MSQKPIPGNGKERHTEPADELWVEEVPSSQARARWNALLERIQQRGGEVRITRYGQVVARLLPAEPPQVRPTFVGSLAGSVVHEGDLISPLDVVWEAAAEGENDRAEGGDGPAERGDGPAERSSPQGG